MSTKSYLHFLECVPCTLQTEKTNIRGVISAIKHNQQEQRKTHSHEIWVTLAKISEPTCSDRKRVAP